VLPLLLPFSTLHICRSILLLLLIMRKWKYRNVVASCGIICTSVPQKYVAWRTGSVIRMRWYLKCSLLVNKDTRLMIYTICFDIAIYVLSFQKMTLNKDWSFTCIVRKRFAASDAARPMCLGSSSRTTISPRLSTASSAAAVVASWSFSTVSICRKISVEIPLTYRSKMKSVKNYGIMP
jgi:hypothetical protein